MTKTKYTIKKFEELTKKSEISATLTVSSDAFATYQEQALKHFAKIVKVDGFRAGKVPKSVIIKNIGEAAVAEEAINLAIKGTYPQFLKEKKLLIIDAPMIQVATSVDELLKGSDFEYTLTAPVPPVFTVAEYKKLAKTTFSKEINTKVTKKEVDDAIIGLRRQRKQIEFVQAGDEQAAATKKAEEVKDADLPELDDAFLGMLGGFKTFDEFKIKLKENMIKDKEAKELNKRRTGFIDTLVEKTKIDLPTVLTAHELDRLKAQFEDDLKRVGSTLEAYLQSVSKSQEDFAEELKPQAQKQAKLQLILNKIAEDEKLIPTEKVVDTELKHIMEHHKDVNEASARAYVTMQIRNQMVFSFLEGADTAKK